MNPYSRGIIHRLSMRRYRMDNVLVPFDRLELEPGRFPYRRPRHRHCRRLATAAAAETIVQVPARVWL